MEILANHCHLFPPTSRDRADAETLLKHLDALGINRAVVFAPFAWRVDNNMRRANQWILEQTHENPRLIPFATINPVHPEAEAVLKFMHAEGVKGCKIHPSVDIFDLTESKAMEFYSLAASLNILLNFHTGIHNSPMEFANPLKFDTMMWSIPDLRVNLEHIGGRCFFELTLGIAHNHDQKPNRLYLGATGILEKTNNPQFYLGKKRTRRVVDEIGADRIIFGLDFPWHSLEDNRAALNTWLQMDIDQSDKQKILGENLLGLVK